MRGKPRLLSGAIKGVIGDGMLDRARATSLALLGVTAALGLAMVALALNQNWPLIPGAPIPGLGDRQAAIGDAAVAAGVKSPGHRGATMSGPAGGRGPRVSNRPAGGKAGGTPSPEDAQPTSESVVVSDSTPARSPAGGPADDASPAPAPAAEAPVTTTAPAAAPVPAPQVSSPSQPPADSASAPPAQAPLPAAGTPPEESSEEGDEDDDSQGEGDEEDWGGDHGHSGDYRGHGHAYGHDRG